MKMLLVPLVALILISSVASQNPTLTKTTELTGEIRVDGKPMEIGRILFYSREGQIVGCIIREGKYKIEKPNVGEQIVTIDGQNVAKKYSESEKSGLICEIRQDINNRLDFNLMGK